MSATVKADGAILALERLRDQLATHVAYALKETARYAEKQAKYTRLFEDKTGQLRQATRAEFVSSQWRSFIINETSYAHHVEHGTEPHTIRAINAPKLRFFWEKIGQDVEFDAVHHPGTKARPFFKAAGSLGETFLSNRLSRAVRSSVGRYQQAK